MATKLSRWTADTIATVVTNAPTGCQAIIVTNERHLVAIGSGGDPRKIHGQTEKTTLTGHLKLQTPQVIYKSLQVVELSWQHHLAMTLLSLVILV